MQWNWLVAILIKLFADFMGLISGPFREIVIQTVRNLYEEAKKTDTVWDDYFVEFLAKVLGIDLTTGP